ncbi:hypothetical protein ACIA48_01155 [Mycobacterium sp. NPDC051804]|uniref:hypothetical protein n=1 Tax=Mycobacterium sp. NPDC051804 TaxID=3364295 RepID=UPI00379B12B3
MKDGSDGANGDPSPTGETFGLASADDKGPANIITEDPSCAAWLPIDRNFSDAANKGWNGRDTQIPATDWTPELRDAYEGVGRTLRTNADQAVQLARVTPHRVMRELYEQFIAYARAYSDAVPSYQASDDKLAKVVLSTSTVLSDVCSSIEWKSAQSRAPFVPPSQPPSEIAPLSSPGNPQRMMTDLDPTCPKWKTLIDQFSADTQDWIDLNPNIPAKDWTPSQRAVIDRVTPVMEENADAVEELGRKSSNPQIQDFAVFSAQYRRAYVAALPTYAAADFYLSRVAARATSLISSACDAVGA